MPLSTWDGYTVFVVLLTIIVSTFFMGIATRRVYRIRLNTIVDTNDTKYGFNILEKICLFLSFATVVIVVGLQMSNADYETYNSLYKYTYSYSTINDYFRIEGLFRAINKFVYNYLHEFQYVILIVSCITNIFMFSNIIYYSLQSKVNPKHALFIYLSMYLLVSFGLLRQICAASIVIFSLRYIQQKHKYVFVTVLALGFHATAIISLPLFLFSAINIKSKDIKLLYRIATVIGFYFVAIFSNQILAVVGRLLGRTNYSDYYAVESIGFGNIVYRIPILIFLLVFSSIIKKSPVYVKMFSGLVLFEVLLCFTYYFIPMLGGRLQYYIIFGYTIVIPYCLNRISDKKNSLPMWSNLIVYGYGFYYLFNQLLTTGWITKYLMPIRFFKF